MKIYLCSARDHSCTRSLQPEVLSQSQPLAGRGENTRGGSDRRKSRQSFSRKREIITKALAACPGIGFVWIRES